MATPYMAHICEVVKEFNEANQKLHNGQFANQFTNCYEWFVDALQHCTDLVFSSQSTLTGWVIQKTIGTGIRLFSKTHYSTELASNYIKIDPFKLRRNECNQLFAGVSRDYITLASKYLISLNLNIFFAFFVIMWLMVFCYLLHYKYLPIKFRRRRRRIINSNNSTHSSSTTTLSVASDSSYASFPTPRPLKLKDNIIARYALRTQRIDRKNLHVIFDLYHTPTILAQIMKKPITDVLCCLNPAQPLAENIHDGIIVKLFRTDDYRFENYNHLIKKTFKSRLILEIDLDITKENETNIRCSRIRNVQLLVNRDDLVTNKKTAISAGYEDRQIILNYDHLRAIEEKKFDGNFSYSVQEQQQHLMLQRKEQQQQQQQLMIQRQEQQQLMLQRQEQQQQQQLMLQEQQQQQLLLQRQEQQQQLLLQQQDQQQQQQLQQRLQQQLLQQQQQQKQDQQLLQQQQQQQQQLRQRRCQQQQQLQQQQQQQMQQQQQQQQMQQQQQQQMQQQQQQQMQQQQQQQMQQQQQQKMQQQQQQQQHQEQRQQQRRRTAAQIPNVTTTDELKLKQTTSLLPKSSSVDVDVISKSHMNTEKKIMNNIKATMTASSGPPKPVPPIPSRPSPASTSSSIKNTGTIPKRPTTLRSATQIVTPQYSPRATDMKKSKSDTFCSRDPIPLKKLKDSNLFTIKDMKKKPSAAVQGTEQGGKSDKKNWKY